MKLVIFEDEDGQVSAVFGRGLPENLDVRVVSDPPGSRVVSDPPSAYKYKLLSMDLPLYVEEIPGTAIYGSEVAVSLDSDGSDRIATFQSSNLRPVTTEEIAALLRNLGFESVHIVREDAE